MLPPPPRSTLFPYTTLFRSHHAPCPRRRARRRQGWWRGMSFLAYTPFIDPINAHRWWYLLLVPLALGIAVARSEEHTSELQSHSDLVCRLLLEKKKNVTS